MLSIPKPKNAQLSHDAESDGISISVSVLSSSTTTSDEFNVSMTVVVVDDTSYPLPIYRAKPKNAAIDIILSMLVNRPDDLKNPHIIKPNEKANMNTNNPVSSCGIIYPNGLLSLRFLGSLYIILSSSTCSLSASLFQASDPMTDSSSFTMCSLLPCFLLTSYR